MDRTVSIANLSISGIPWTGLHLWNCRRLWSLTLRHAQGTQGCQQPHMLVFLRQSTSGPPTVSRPEQSGHGDHAVREFASERVTTTSSLTLTGATAAKRRQSTRDAFVACMAFGDKTSYQFKQNPARQSEEHHSL